MTDLHARLLAAVQQRMDVARAADGACWHVDYCDEGAMSDFHDQNMPATILRHCERDLRVLERHAEDDGYCNACCAPFVAGEVQEAEWPCDEITDLCSAYGIEVNG